MTPDLKNLVNDLMSDVVFGLNDYLTRLERSGTGINQEFSEYVERGKPLIVPRAVLVAYLYDMADRQQGMAPRSEQANYQALIRNLKKF